MSPARCIWSGLAASVIVGLSGLAACGSPPSGLDGSIGKGTSAGTLTTPGVVADYTGFLANHTGRVVTLQSARLLPLTGYRTPRLVRLAVEQGHDFVASWRGWPPHGHGLHLAPFAGYRVWRGHRVQILYGVVAAKPGRYADAGIRVTVLVGGSLVSVNVLSYAGTCVKRVLKVDCPDSFYKGIENASIADP